MKKYLIRTLVFCFCQGLIISVNAQVVNFYPEKDNTIYSEADSSNGKGHYLFSGKNKSGFDRRALLKFDLSSVSETDSVISASLQLHMSKTTSGSQVVKLYGLSGDWGEGESDAIYEEGGGALPKTNDATWNYSFFDSKLWTSPGGDYNITHSASLTVGDTGIYTWSDVKLTGDIQKWIKTPENNFGWIIIVDENESSSKRFDSKDNPGFKPKLTLELIPVSGISSSLNKDFKVYPNPSSGKFFIHSTNSQPITNIEILDVKGRVIKNESLNITGHGRDYQIFLKDKGMYFIRVNNQTFTKIVIQ